MDQRHFIVVTNAQQPFNINEQVLSTVGPVVQNQPQFLTTQNTITIPISIQNEDNFRETTQLQFTIPQMEGCGTQLSLVPNNIVVPVQQYQPGETIIFNSAIPTVSTGILTPEDLGMNKESYLVTTTNTNRDQNLIESDNSTNNSTQTQVTVVTPDGEEKEIVFRHSPEKLNVPYILYKVCRSIGIDDPMEGHMDCEPEEIRQQRKEQMQELFKKCQQEDNMESPKKNEEKSNNSLKLKPSSNGVLICTFCGNLSSSVDKRCRQCKRVFPPVGKPENNTQNLKLVFVQAATPVANSAILELKKRKCSRKKKHDEPVCLTISSDEEEEEEKSEKAVIQSNENDVKPKPVISQLVKEKEPIITESTEAPFQTRIKGGGVDITELLDSPELEKALLQCRTVRIGSYKVVPEGKVTLSEYGLKFKIPALNGDQTVIKILRTDIIKVLAHFGKQMPVLFYYMTNGAGIKIRNALKMLHKPEKIYFDPTSNVEMHRRITLLPEKIPDDMRLFIKSVYDSQCLLDELSSKEANEILVRSTYEEVQTPVTPPKKDNFQIPSAVGPSLQKIQTIMVYPPPPAKGGISINTEDYACLGEDLFLNDVIIDFYLKWVFLTKLSAEDQKRTHIFSSFFYKRLTTKASPGGINKYQDDPKLSPAERRHARVKGWTKSVDLFSKDFIIIPINENSHWFLGIVCFPGLTHPARIVDNAPINIPTKKANKRNVPSMIGATTITMVQPEPLITVEGEDEERDEAEAEDDDLEPNTSDDEGKEGQDDTELLDEATPRLTRSIKLEQEDPIKQPCILVFDSLAGASRSRVCATLREYLQVEYSLKHKGRKRDFSKDTIKGAVPQVPQQTNYTDCGLYVLQYVEAFFERPITNFKMPIKMLKEWFPTDIVSRKRFDIQQLLHSLMEEQNVDISRLNLPQLNPYPDGMNPLVNYSDEGEEMEECDIPIETAEITAMDVSIQMEDSDVEEEMEEEELIEEEEEEEVVIKTPVTLKKIPIQNASLSKLGEITVSSSSNTGSRSATKRKSTPVTLKEVRNPRLTPRSTPEKKLRSD